MKAIVPTGGRGTRMQPITFSTNKHFIPVANKPLIYYPLEAIAGAGIKDVAITYNPGWLDVVKKYIGDGNKWGLNITYILQERPAGLANIFQVCEEYLKGESFFLHLGDNIFVDGIEELVKHFEKSKPNGLVAMVHSKDNTRLGVPYFDDKGKLIKYVEKPSNSPHDFAIPGIYFFDSNVFKCFKGKSAIKPSERGEYEISSSYQWLIDNGYKVEILEYKGKWLDPGKIDDWMDANSYLLEKKTKGVNKSKQGVGVKLIGKVDIGENCKIENSEITGPVSLGNCVEVIYSKIGPSTSVGDGCLIEKAEIENSVLMPKVKIKNLQGKIKDSLIGTETEIEGNGNCHSFLTGEKCHIKI